MTPLLVIHGAGMSMRGKALTEIFGTMTLPEYDAHIRRYAADLGFAPEIFHSNAEGAVIDRLFAAHDAGVAAAIINPDGFTRGYPALVGAITRVGFPVIEVHISNPARRGLASDIATACRGTVTGFGVAGYEVAMRGIRAILAG